MAYTYDDFLDAVNSAGMMGNFSSYDLNLAKENPAAGMGILSAKQQYAAATDEAGRLAANQRAEEIRATGGSYTGGRYGLEYNPFGTGLYAGSGYEDDISALTDELLNRPSFNYKSYESQYSDQIADYLDRLTDRKPFEYNYAEDDSYKAYKKQYLREGDRATQNAIAQAAALTGGVPSSAAVTAATQAGDYYAAQLSDRIPQLEQNAYDRYVNDYNMDANTLSMLQSLDDSAYSRYANDRAFDYQQWMDDYNINLNNLSMLQSLDDTAYNRFMNQLQYAAEHDAANFEKDYNMAVLAAEYGDYSYLRQLGIDTSALEAAGRSYSGGGYGGGGYGYDPEIEALQQELVDAGYNLEIDGIYGPSTQQAYEDYQNAVGGGEGGGILVLDPTSSLLGPQFSSYRTLLEKLYDKAINYGYENEEQMMQGFWFDARAAGIPDEDTRYFLDTLSK